MEQSNFVIYAGSLTRSKRADDFCVRDGTLFFIDFGRDDVP